MTSLYRLGSIVHNLEDHNPRRKEWVGQCTQFKHVPVPSSLLIVEAHPLPHFLPPDHFVRLMAMDLMEPFGGDWPRRVVIQLTGTCRLAQPTS